MDNPQDGIDMLAKIVLIVGILMWFIVMGGFNFN